MSESLIRPQVMLAESLRAYGSVVIKPPRGYLLLACLLLSFMGAGVYLLITAQYTRTESVPGYLLPEGGLSRRYPERRALVDSVRVTAGQRVQKGEVLLTLSYDALLPERRGNLRERLAQLQERTLQAEQRRRAELTELHDRSLALEKQVTAIEGQMALQQAWLQQVRTRLEGMQDAHARGLVVRAEVERLRAEILAGELNLQAGHRELLAQHSERTVQAALRDRMAADHAMRMATYAQQRLEIEALMLENDARSTHRVTAQKDSVVVSIGVKPGEQIGPEREMVVLAAQESKLYAQLYVPVQSVGFIAPGQQVRIRYDSFPAAKYGSFLGMLEAVSAFVTDVRTPVVPLPLSGPTFQARAQVREQQVFVRGRQVPLLAGMTLRADIRTQTRSLVEWVFEPLFAAGEMPFSRQ